MTIRLSLRLLATALLLFVAWVAIDAACYLLTRPSNLAVLLGALMLIVQVCVTSMGLEVIWKKEKHEKDSVIDARPADGSPV